MNVLRVAVVARLDEPRVELRTHLAGKLAGNRASGDVNQFFGQHRSGWQVVARGEQSGDNRCDRGKVGRFRPALIEAGWALRASREHDVVPGGVDVVGVRQRPHQRPFIAASCQHGEVFANLNSSRARGNRFELAANVFGSVGLHVETIVLAQAAGKENINDGFGIRDLDRRAGLGRERSQLVEVVGSQPEQPTAPA